MPVFGRLHLNESTNCRWWYYAFLCKAAPCRSWFRGDFVDRINARTKDIHQLIVLLHFITSLGSSYPTKSTILSSKVLSDHSIAPFQRSPLGHLNFKPTRYSK
jgi:hypothetical protein